MIHGLQHMIGSHDSRAEHEGVWVRAVPLPFMGGLIDRCRDAWSVIRGKSYAVRWPEAGEFERAVGRADDLVGPARLVRQPGRRVS